MFVVVYLFCFGLCSTRFSIATTMFPDVFLQDNHMHKNTEECTEDVTLSPLNTWGLIFSISYEKWKDQDCKATPVKSYFQGLLPPPKPEQLVALHLPSGSTQGGSAFSAHTSSLFPVQLALLQGFPLCSPFCTPKSHRVTINLMHRWMWGCSQCCCHHPLTISEVISSWAFLQCVVQLFVTDLPY